MRIGGDFGQLARKIEMHTDLAHAQVVIAQRQSIFQDSIQTDWDALGFMLAREAQQVLHDAVSSLGLLVQVFRYSPRPEGPISPLDDKSWL